MIGERTLFRAYLLSTDHAYLASTYERLVQHARKRHLAGVTVQRGVYGFGSRAIQDPECGWQLSHPTPVILEKARELGLAGATVLRGSGGFGANSVLHTAKVLELSTDLPIVIELVDTEERIQKLLPHLDAMVNEGMITMESVRILVYRHNPMDASQAPGKT